MTGLYYADLIDVLEAAGVQCGENSINAGWQTRARSSGGFPSAPKGIVWHHTASKTSVESDLAWMIDNCDDAPVGNMLIDRAGIVWPIAAGASNCAGKGGPASFSRGTVAKDSGNTGCWNIEVANNGVGEVWPVAQIDAYFAASNALNMRFGNQPDDVITHNVWAPDRKIDPAVAASVQGAWIPHAVNSSGTWNLDEIKNECVARAGSTPTPPTPLPGDDEDMKHIIAPERGQMIVGAGFRHWATTQEEGYEMNLLYGPAIEVSTRDYDVIAEIHTVKN